MNLEDRYYIDPAQKDKGMITLTCNNHPTLWWTTKNIAPLGCRTIFFFCKNNEVECSCPNSALRIVPDISILEYTL